jgi:hypothetical protein
MENLILMTFLLMKHCYADFVIQSYKQTVRKGIYGDLVGISHSLDHVWTTMFVLLVFSILVTPLSAGMIFLLAAVEGIIHYHIDWCKVKYGSKDVTKPKFWSEFGHDQLSHHLTYVAMCAILLL